MSTSMPSFGKWMSLFLLVYLAFDLAFVCLARLALDIASRYLLQSFVLILACGIIASFLTYWTRQAYDRPALCGFRLALSFFVYLMMFMSALLISGARSGLISRESILSNFISIICPGSAIAAIAVYFAAKNKLKQIYIGGYKTSRK